MSQAQPMGQEKRLFHTLDMLRGIAAIAVVGRHLNHSMLALMPSSHLAVDLFFVLSGFVLAHAYEQRLRADFGVIAFMKVRIVRLYPLYIMGTAIGITMFLGKYISSSNDLTDTISVSASIVFGLLFIPVSKDLSANHFHMYPFNFPAWSLCWELSINLLYALVARWLGTKALAAFIAVGAVLLALCAWTFNGLEGGTNYTNFSEGALRVGYSFFAGVAVYRIWKSGRFNFFLLPPWLAALILVAVMMIRPSAPAVYDFAVVLVVFPLLILAATREPSARALPICTALGTLSYPLYALHGPFTHIELAMRGRLGAHEGLLGLPLEIAFIAVMIVLALIAERFFDRPARRWLSRFSTRPALPALVGAS